MESKRKNLRKNRGITLVALVITIIILLILAGISIAQLTGTGIFAKAEEAKQKYKDAEDLENQILANYEAQLNRLGKSTVGSGDVTGGGDDEDKEQNDPPTPSGPTDPATSVTEAKNDDMFNKTVNSTVQDDYENKVVIPAGFKIAEDSGSNVTEGIVIKDENDNEFVWIPVGEVKTKDKEPKTITLSRYTFDTNGNPTKQDAAEIKGGSYKYKEEQTSTSKNAKAKDLAGFKNSVEKNHGYYIGRYEARKNGEGNKVTEKATDTVWNNITQPQASQQCQTMYTDNSNFTSDLMNSYAWDTAIVFLQGFDNREETKKSTPYSKQTRVTSTFASTGTNNTDIKDVICNIYDMANNVQEWSTETYTGSSFRCWQGRLL